MQLTIYEEHGAEVNLDGMYQTDIRLLRKLLKEVRQKLKKRLATYKTRLYKCDGCGDIRDAPLDDLPITGPPFCTFCSRERSPIEKNYQGFLVSMMPDLPADVAAST